MATINQQRQRVEQEVTQLVDNLDRTHMRRMQVRSLINKCLLNFNFAIFIKIKNYET